MILLDTMEPFCLKLSIMKNEVLFTLIFIVRLKLSSMLVTVACKHDEIIKFT